MISIVKTISTYFLKYKYKVFFYILLCLIGSAFSLASPYITGNFIDSLIIGKGYTSLYRYCSLFFLIFVFTTIINYISRKLYIYLQMNIGFRFNMDIVNHVQKIDTSLFGSLNTAYLSQQINNDTNELIILV